ncbi:MAG: FG-GAP-like repeat-containing protein, partial [Desulfobacterales bacterium]
AIAVGDVDGDQKVEVVMAGRETIYVYRMEAGGGMQRVSEIPLDHWVTVFGVDTADLNGNGIEELFISARDDKFRPDSFVMEWDGAQFATIEKNSRWYFRAVPDPVSGERVLYGQQGGLRDPLFGAVYAMGWSDGRYSPQEKQFVPNQSTVFGFATGDVLHTGEPVVVSFVKGEKLRITMPNGREEWTSADRYGGRSDYLVPSEEYVQLQRESRANPDPEPMSRDWLAQRVIIDDVNGDGKQEVLVVMNHDQTGGVFERLRSFTKGRFECLQWDNIGLQPLWRTRYFTGYISDYDYADPNNDGQKELIFCVVKEIGDPITGSKISYLVVWKPEQAAAAPPTPAPASQ